MTAPQQPAMPLEEVKTFIRNFLKLGEDCLRQARERGGVTPWGMDADTLEKQEAHVEALRATLHHLEAGKKIHEAAMWSLAQANAYGPMDDPQWLEDYCKASDVILPTIPGNEALSPTPPQQA